MIRIAQLGAGRMGSLHARNAAANPRLDLAWLVDPKPEQAAALAGELGATVTTFEAVLADPDVRGVIIASSTDAHLGDTLACLRAGKAVFCEKPLSLSADDLAAAEAELTAPGLPPLFVAFNRRFDPHFQALKARLDAGEIGALETLHLINHDPAPPPPNFIPRSGGLFRDFTIHDFDTAAWLMGQETVEIFAWAACLVDPEIGAQGDVDTAKLVLRGAKGALCMISNSRRTGYGYDQRIEAFGSSGALRVDNLTVTSVSRWGAEGPARDSFPYGFADRYAEAYARELDHFADVIEHGATPRTGFAESLNAIRLADAAARSVGTGRSIDLTTEAPGHA